jgi:hypothetical protein
LAEGERPPDSAPGIRVLLPAISFEVDQRSGATRPTTIVATGANGVLAQTQHSRHQPQSTPSG